VDNSRVWVAISEVSDKMLLSKIRINKSLVEEALSLDPEQLASIPDDGLRKYLVVLGQFLMTVQYEENTLDAVRAAWDKTLEIQLMTALAANQNIPGKTVTEKRAWVLNNDRDCMEFSSELLVAEAKHNIMRNMGRSVEQYINTLKKEIDARESEKARFNR
jgi:hypothetical protein